MLGIDHLRLYDIDPDGDGQMRRNLQGMGFAFVACVAEDAVEGAEIITTCTADKQYATVLTDDMVGAGVHINAIGGDCPGKTDCTRHPAALGVFVEYPPQTRIEGEIQQLAPTIRSPSSGK